MAELGDDVKGTRRADSSKAGENAGSNGSDDTAGTGAQSGVKIEKKGQQTVIHVTSLLTGMPTAGAAPLTSPAATTIYPGVPAAGYYGGYAAPQWPGYPPQTYAQPQADAAQQQWGYYQGMPMDPAMAAYYNSDAYAAYVQQYSAQQGAYAQAPAQGPPA